MGNTHEALFDFSGVHHSLDAIYLSGKSDLKIDNLS